MAGVAAVVFFNHGRWVARCPRPSCMNAEMFGKDGRGNPGGLTGSFRCRTEEGGCGLRCDAQWPTPEDLEAIEWLMKQRPVMATRNWDPSESIDDLLVENLEHGLIPMSPEALKEHPGGIVLRLEGNRFSGGRLTSTTWAGEIGAKAGDA